MRADLSLVAWSGRLGGDVRGKCVEKSGEVAVRDVLAEDIVVPWQAGFGRAHDGDAEVAENSPQVRLGHGGAGAVESGADDRGALAVPGIAAPWARAPVQHVFQDTRN